MEREIKQIIIEEDQEYTSYSHKATPHTTRVFHPVLNTVNNGRSSMTYDNSYYTYHTSYTYEYSGSQRKRNTVTFVTNDDERIYMEVADCALAREIEANLPAKVAFIKVLGQYTEAQYNNKCMLNIDGLTKLALLGSGAVALSIMTIAIIWQYWD